MSENYCRPDFEEAKEYGRLIKIKGSHVTVSRIRMFDRHMYNWSSTIISGSRLYTPTDQTYDLEANFHGDVYFWDEIWLDGVRLYKKPLWRRVLFWWNMD